MDKAFHRAYQGKCWKDDRVGYSAEGNFREAERADSLDRLKAKLKETTKTVISMVLIAMSMKYFLGEEAYLYFSKALHDCFLIYLKF